MWFLLVVYAAFGDTTQETLLVPTDFPLSTWEECTETAERLAIVSVVNNPELAPYKFYLCVKESI
jgi:hypothetical protein